MITTDVYAHNKEGAHSTKSKEKLKRSIPDAPWQARNEPCDK